MNVPCSVCGTTNGVHPAGCPYHQSTDGTARDAVLLREIGTQLEDWARESIKGGWSTHQVEPQQRLANRIWAHLGRRP